MAADRGRRMWPADSCIEDDGGSPGRDDGGRAEKDESMKHPEQGPKWKYLDR
jgi:hypothetical protein